MTEDRGTHHFVWTDQCGTYSFSPFPGALARIVVSVPIGWTLTHHKEKGVVLANVFGVRKTAAEVIRAMLDGRDGFRAPAPAERVIVPPRETPGGPATG